MSNTGKPSVNWSGLVLVPTFSVQLPYEVPNCRLNMLASKVFTRDSTWELI